MSIRRRSCDTCFAGRRKCDLAFPTCGRCQRTHKACQYAYPPQTPAPSGPGSSEPAPGTPSFIGPVVDVDFLMPLETSAAAPGNSMAEVTQMETWSQSPEFWWEQDPSTTAMLEPWMPTSIPKTLGILGEMQPLVYDTIDSPWVLSQYREYPRMLAEEAATPFIHQDLYNQYLPQAMQAAFGVCAGSTRMNERSRSMLFRTLDAEFAKLQNIAPTETTLLDDLASLQAVLLYQSIRIFKGDLQQRIAAEQQAHLVEALALRLLRRADIELSRKNRTITDNDSDNSSDKTWESWIVAESVRRTVFIVLKLYVIFFQFRTGGLCYQSKSSMWLVPLSARPGIWNAGRDVFAMMPPEVVDETVQLKEVRNVWDKEPGMNDRTDGFERLVLVGCTETLRAPWKEIGEV
ncbi:uncharacterized protein B0I36DRAFT_326500 [Microdochium trichocladiopsis]|uniref:Zn(2)-C6 fungal-type domain-containing protein n=1 Tax=Microdochium trichocladiopsis TaxID=1682393 RepID=A0A9P8Y5F5_9PEZI|nr:uncharacterized protein B0I36DRAFT_326500 [Microdochium trichocladiopsis]KAH7029912.1 hypothetical protein B0I36DRAFT_326500 [Microdochium trichocladiopsis]